MKKNFNRIFFNIIFLLSGTVIGAANPARLIDPLEMGVYSKDHLGRTALLLAVIEEDLPTVELLIRLGADPNEEIQSMAHLVLENKNTGQLISAFFESGLPAKISFQDLSPIAREHRAPIAVKFRSPLWSPLFEAALRGNIKIVHALLTAGACVSIKTSVDGIVPADCARINGHKDIKWLLSQLGPITADSVVACTSEPRSEAGCSASGEELFRVGVNDFSEDEEVPEKNTDAIDLI